MINAIQEITNLFKENNIPCWIDCGVLLKLYRDGEIKDDDIDLGLFIEDYDKVLNLLSPKFIIHKWRNQMVFTYKGFQTDLFFCSVDDKYLYLYAYYSDGKSEGRCNVEFRIKYPKEVCLPLKEFTFKNGMTFLVPNDIEKNLELHYGDWKTPIDKPWYYFDIPAWDKTYLERNINLTDPNGKIL
jgi:phosphorylcholine metabolism protein LicD